LYYDRTVPTGERTTGPNGRHRRGRILQLYWWSSAAKEYDDDDDDDDESVGSWRVVRPTAFCGSRETGTRGGDVDIHLRYGSAAGRQSTEERFERWSSLSLRPPAGSLRF
jgi:hypothetical protein